MSERPFPIPQDPREFITWCIDQHEQAALVLESVDREAWLQSLPGSRYADPVWHREVNEVYRKVLERL